MAKSRTIQIFLKDSENDGIKIANLSNAIARVYVIPRDKIDFIQNRPELSTPALYMLFDDERTTVYIGESENFKSRVVDHLINKHFWKWAIVCIAMGEGMDKADVKYLESYAINKAIEIGRFEVQNKTSPNTNNLGEFKLASIVDLFDDFELLITTLGFNVFEQIKDSGINQINEIKKREELDVRTFDTIICPTKDNGKEEAFEKESAWWAVRISQNNLSKIKYVGLYETAPIGAIRYYAKVTKIEPYPENPSKYIIRHDGNIIELENHIILGENPGLALFGPRYYKLEDIKKSKTMAELTERTFGTKIIKNDAK